MKHAAVILVVLIALAAPSSAGAIDWLTAPSHYTHDHVTGDRVAQFSQIGPYYYYARPDFLRSGYRHYRSTIQAGGSADNLHIVEEWGRPVRPYGEWRFPYRPYSVPYSQWGPPFGGLGPGGVFAPGGFGFGAFAPGPFPHGGHDHHGPANFAQPWLDGYYPQYDQDDRSPYYRPYGP